MRLTVHRRTGIGDMVAGRNGLPKSLRRIGRPVVVQRRPSRVKMAGFAAAGVGAGVVLEYLLDPERGRSRRAKLRDKTRRAAHETNDDMRGWRKDVANRTRGVAASARYRVAGRKADDDVLHDRVRAELGRHVRYPHAVEVHVKDRVVTLAGDVLADEERETARAIKHIPGVKQVEEHWKVHTEPDNIPTMQGPGKRH
jgi:hypothetical protein